VGQGLVELADRAAAADPRYCVKCMREEPETTTCTAGHAVCHACLLNWLPTTTLRGGALGCPSHQTCTMEELPTFLTTPKGAACASGYWRLRVAEAQRTRPPGDILERLVRGVPCPTAGCAFVFGGPTDADMCAETWCPQCKVHLCSLCLCPAASSQDAHLLVALCELQPVPRKGPWRTPEEKVKALTLRVALQLVNQLAGRPLEEAAALLAPLEGDLRGRWDVRADDILSLLDPARAAEARHSLPLAAALLFEKAAAGQWRHPVHDPARLAAFNDDQAADRAPPQLLLRDGEEAGSTLAVALRELLDKGAPPALVDETRWLLARVPECQAALRAAEYQGWVWGVDLSGRQHLPRVEALLERAKAFALASV
jgi:hypothetical protein